MEQIKYNMSDTESVDKLRNALTKLEDAYQEASALGIRFNTFVSGKYIQSVPYVTTIEGECHSFSKYCLNKDDVG
jgi:hypothetical protein